MTPTVLSPASPVELLHYIVTFQTYPTTILVCYPRDDFISTLTSTVQNHNSIPPEDHQILNDSHPPPLLSATLYQTAVARHIRVLFIPTVIHLRAYLSAFDPANSLTPPPPNHPPPSSGKRRPPLLLVYGFLDLHRDSSEWSAQGLSSSAAALVEAARRTGFKPAIVEPRGAGGHGDFKAVLRDDAPVLSGGSRRDDGVWTGRTVEVKRVLGRWFHFQTGQWDV
ncbi:hypothetical protein CH063_13239 [Colletotrichum higginsianum]|uniref:Uncharacterized protein n=2 Tax=Colletotrichum higginsianum TaxID=80884 RepID=H1VTM2_COLHI|nr:hypothetical protein CH63R_13501 [Colletotrichum higginsianum IMI 349063]OBR02275.1 hypothetical protein CH63R_13501 [Colletotrichum higginsianum IMI 349063]TID07310.1 hypothetical protein CH35J_000039 [Colletotrichum higginsianum]CCF43580.1 hypothetical protein CH063_13239 [Colletotrichum higginsianum]